MPWTTETLLKAIGEAAPRDCITEARLVELTGYTAKQVENACQNLRRHGFIKRTGKGCHKLTDAGCAALSDGAKLRSGPRGRETGFRSRDPGLRQRAWNCLRLCRKLTYDDIAMRVVEGGERNARDNIRKYVGALAKAGYVQFMERRETALNQTSNGCLRFILVSDTGPLAPIWRAAHGTIYDPNIEREISLARTAEGIAP
jgi:hypothetical protein